jgi:mitotic spindle assembly checkpoint protein MAD1
LETKLREKDAVIEKLEGDRRWLSEREKEEKEARIAENTENSAEKVCLLSAIKHIGLLLRGVQRKLEDDLRTLRTVLSGLQEQLADLKDAHSELSLSSSRTISTQKSQVSSLTQRVSALNSSLDESRRLAEERVMKVRELEDRLESSHATKPVKESNDDWTVLNKQLQQTTSYLQELESTNAKMTSELSILRERHGSLEVLREEKRGLEAKVRSMEEMREKIIRLEAQLDVYVAFLHFHSHVYFPLRDNCRAKKKTSIQQVPTPENQTLLALRRAHAKLLEEQGLNISSLASLERANTELSGDVEKLSAELVEVKRQLSERDMEMRRREGRWEIGEREVRGLKALLVCFPPP